MSAPLPSIGGYAMTKNNPAKAELAKLLSIKADAMRASGDSGSDNLLYEAADPLAATVASHMLGRWAIEQENAA